MNQPTVLRVRQGPNIQLKDERADEYERRSAAVRLRIVSTGAGPVGPA